MTGSSPTEAKLLNSTAILTGDTVTTACVPVVDRNITSISTTGVLLGVLCLEFTVQEEVSVCFSLRALFLCVLVKVH